MKRLLAAALFCCAGVLAQDLKPGSPVTPFTLTDLKGKSIRVEDFHGGPAVVAFISTKCPISNAYNDRMSALYREYSPKGVRFFFVNANANEFASEVMEHARSAAFPFPVYKDDGNHAADLFGAMATPETYVIGTGGVLRYHGYVDDSSNEARVKVHGLKNAIDAVLAGNPVVPSETKAFGCTIKRVRRTT